MLRKVPLADARQASFAEFRARHGRALEDWAAWCALAEMHGPDYRTWPARAARPAVRGTGGTARRPRRAGRVPHLGAVARRRAGRRRAGGGAGGGHEHRHHRRPGDRRAPRRGGRVGRAGVLRHGVHRRRAAGRVQPARPGLGAAAHAPRRAGGRRVPAAGRPHRRQPAPRRRPADRPRHGPVPAVVDPRGRAADRGRVRVLRRAGHARHARRGGRRDRVRRRRRGPRHGRALAARGAGRPGRPGHPDALVRARLVRRAARPAVVAEELAWSRCPPTTCRPPPRSCRASR